MGKMIKGISKNARFYIVDSTDVVQEALNIHKTSPTATDAFGRILTAGLIMGGTLKGNDMLTLRTQTDGPLSSIVVTADANGNVKGYVSNPKVDVPLNDRGKSDVPALLGKGTMQVIKDMGLKEPYVGISPIESGEIGQDLAYYFYTSDQIPTVIALGVHLKDEKTVLHAGGYMVQALPNSDESFLDALEVKIEAIRPVTELLAGGMSVEDIAALLYDDMYSETKKNIEEYEILETSEVEYHCNSSKERFKKGLETLGKDTIKDILKDDKIIKTECQFCKEEYVFDEKDFKDLLGE